MNDVGMLSSQLYHYNIQPILNDIAGINLGSVYESAVAQELKAHYEKLFYYGNKQKGEVDFPSAIGRLRVAGLGALVNVSPISALDALLSRFLMWRQNICAENPLFTKFNRTTIKSNEKIMECL